MTKDQFVTELGTIEGRVKEMAEHAGAMLRDGVQALADLDREAADDVISREPTLARFDEDIEREILRFLTLQAPVARDLRRTGTALKLITYITRIGRYGYDIARVCRDWPEGKDHVARMVSIRDMAAKVEQMLAVAIEAFAEHRAADEARLLELEEDVDAMRWTVFRECLTYMGQDNRNIEPCAHYMMVGRYLERCGDNVIKMAEKLHYAATGQRTLLD